MSKKKKSEPMETALNSQASGLQDVLAAFASSLTHTIPPSHLRHATSQFCQGRSKTSHHLINMPKDILSHRHKDLCEIMSTVVFLKTKGWK